MASKKRIPKAIERAQRGAAAMAKATREKASGPHRTVDPYEEFDADSEMDPETKKYRITLEIEIWENEDPENLLKDFYRTEEAVENLEIVDIDEHGGQS